MDDSETRPLHIRPSDPQKVPPEIVPYILHVVPDLVQYGNFGSPDTFLWKDDTYVPHTLPGFGLTQRARGRILHFELYDWERYWEAQVAQPSHGETLAFLRKEKWLWFFKDRTHNRWTVGLTKDWDGLLEILGRFRDGKKCRSSATVGEQLKLLTRILECLDARKEEGH